MDGSPAHQSLSRRQFRARCAARTTSTSTVTGEIPAGLARRLLSQRPQPAVRAARRLPLVLRRRDDPRLLRRGRQGPLPQPLCAHAEVGAGARGRQGAVRHLRQSDDHRPLGDGQGRRRRQHQHRLACRPAAGAGRRPQAVRARSGRPWSPRGYVDDYRGKVTAHPKIDPETGEMVWFAYSVGDMPFNDTVLLWRHRRGGQGGAPRRLRGAVRSAWCTTSWSPSATRSSRSCR